MKEVVTQPRKIEALKNIKQIAVGEFHSVALSSSGEVYSWGRDYGGVAHHCGSLGHSEKGDVAQPKIIDFFKGQQVVQIVSGSHHCLALTSTGSVYAWGQ